MEFNGNRESLLRQAAVRLRAELEAVLSREPQTFSTALGMFLDERFRAGRYRVTPGWILPPDQASSRLAHDCLVVDASSLPPVTVDAQNALVPVGSVYGVVEAVEDLDDSSLRSAASTVAELKNLARGPRQRRHEAGSGSLLGALVARRGLHGEDLLDAVAAENDTRPFEEQIDVLCILDRGVVAYAEVDADGSVAVEMPVEASARWRLSWLDLGESALLSFYFLLWEALGARELRPPAIHTLLRGLPTGPAVTLPLAHGVDRGE